MALFSHCRIFHIRIISKKSLYHPSNYIILTDANLIQSDCVRAEWALANEPLPVKGKARAGWKSARRLRYLLRTEAWGDPHVLLQCTPRVVIRSGISLEVVHELGDGLLHLQRHGCHYMLLYTEHLSGHRFPCQGNGEKEVECYFETSNHKIPFLTMERVKKKLNLLKNIWWHFLGQKYFQIQLIALSEYTDYCFNCDPYKRLQELQAAHCMENWP